MFRWLAVCVVLCAGAFALVALATGKFLPTPPPPVEIQPAAENAVAADDSVQPAAVNQGADHGGAIVLANARLAPIDREDAPSQHDGTVLFIGTDDPGDLKADRKLPATRVYFLVIQWDNDNGSIPPADIQKQGIALRAAPDCPFRQAVPYTWALQNPAPPDPSVPPPDATKPATAPAKEVLYRRWHEGDPLKPHNVEVAFEDRALYELKEGDWVKKGQLVALVDPTVQVNDVALKVNKVETAESEYVEAGKTKQEAERRAAESRRLWQTGGAGAISMDAYYADLLNAARYAEEEKGKDSARQEATQELQASLTLLKLHEVRAVMPGVIKTIYKHPGEAVKNLEAILHIDNPLKLRVEALGGRAGRAGHP